MGEVDEVDLPAAERRLAEVEAALERVESGSYGRCASCGAAMEDAALAADALRLLCPRCAEAGATPERHTA